MSGERARCRVCYRNRRRRWQFSPRGGSTARRRTLRPGWISSCVRRGGRVPGRCQPALHPIQRTDASEQVVNVSRQVPPAQRRIPVQDLLKNLGASTRRNCSGADLIEKSTGRLLVRMIAPAKCIGILESTKLFKRDQPQSLPTLCRYGQLEHPAQPVARRSLLRRDVLIDPTPPVVPSSPRRPSTCNCAELPFQDWRQVRGELKPEDDGSHEHANTLRTSLAHPTFWRGNSETSSLNCWQ
jgi:hypothetical protein